jgi:hypothetical protein
MPRLTENEKVTIEGLNSKNETNRSVARRLGMSEGTVRYHLRKVREGRRDEDGRREKRFLAREHAEAIEHWLCDRLCKDRQVRSKENPTGPTLPGQPRSPAGRWSNSLPRRTENKGSCLTSPRARPHSPRPKTPPPNPCEFQPPLPPPPSTRADNPHRKPQQSPFPATY